MSAGAGIASLGVPNVIQGDHDESNDAKPNVEGKFKASKKVIVAGGGPLTAIPDPLVTNRTDTSPSHASDANESWEGAMSIWTEFKNTILPWLLASAVVAFMIAEHRRTTGALLDANNRLANAVEQQGKALDGVRSLLASQGYTLPPLSKPQ